MVRVQGIIRKAAFFVLGLSAVQAFGQINGSVSSIFSSTLATSLPRADTVPVSQSISQIADGVGWKTTIILANTDTVPADYTLKFWHGDGTPLSLPTLAQGTQQQITGTIPVNGSVTIETPGAAGGNFSQGWGQLITSNLIGGTTIFRQHIAGQADSEAAVPVIKGGSTSLILPYDNTTGFATALAMVNPDPNNAASVTVNVFDQDGNSLASGVITIPAQGQQTFALTDKFPSTAGHRGAAKFTSSGVPVTGLGLRFSSAGTFTSVEFLPQ